MTFGIGKSAAVVNAAHYGAVDDDSTDNANALLDLRADLLAEVDTPHLIIVPGTGTYRTSNNRWLMGLKYIDIIAPSGAKITCTADNGWDKNGIAAHWGDPFDDTGDQEYNGTNRVHVTGYRFDAVAAGATVLTMTTPGEESNFGLGDRIMLHGYCQQFADASAGGYPPNLRFVEYGVVTAVGSGTVTVEIIGTVTGGTAFAYDDRLRDFTDSVLPSFSYGKPRILNLDRTNYTHPKLVRIRGLKIGANPTLSSADYIWLAGERTQLVDVEAPRMFPTCTEQCALYRPHATEYIEGDKCSGALYVEDGQGDVVSGAAGGGGLRGCTGFRSVYVKRGVYQRELRLGAREVTLDGVEVHSTTDGSNGDGIVQVYGGTPWPVDKLTVENCLLVNESPAGVIKRAISHINVLQSYTVDGVDGGNILIAMGNGGEDAATEIAVGDLLTLDDGSNGGIVGAIYHDGGSPGNLVLEPDSADGWGTPSVGQVYYKQSWREVVDGGGNTVQGDGIPLWGNPLNVGSGDRTLTTPGVPDLDWDIASREWPLVQSFIDEVTINITRAYSGPDATAELRLKRVAGGVENTICVLDLTQTGERVITTTTSSGAKAGDTLTPANLAGYGHKYIVETDNGTGVLNGTDAEMPQTAWSVRVRQFQPVGPASYSEAAAAAGFAHHYETVDGGSWQDSISNSDIGLSDPTTGIDTLVSGGALTSLGFKPAAYGVAAGLLDGTTSLTLHWRLQIDEHPGAAGKYQLINHGTNPDFGVELRDDGDGGLHARVIREGGSGLVIYHTFAATIPIGTAFQLDVRLNDNGTMSVLVDGSPLTLHNELGSFPASWPSLIAATTYLFVWQDQTRDAYSGLGQHFAWHAGEISDADLQSIQSSFSNQNVVWLPSSHDAGKVDTNGTKTVDLSSIAHPGANFDQINFGAPTPSLGSLSLDGEAVDYDAGGTEGEDSFGVEVVKGGLSAQTTVDVEVEATTASSVVMHGFYSAHQDPNSFFEEFGANRIVDYWNPKNDPDPRVAAWVSQGATVAAIASLCATTEGTGSCDEDITKEDLVSYWEGKLGGTHNINALTLDELSRNNNWRGNNPPTPAWGIIAMDAMEDFKTANPNAKLYVALTMNTQWATSSSSYESRLRQLTVDGVIDLLFVEMYQECDLNCSLADPDLSQIIAHTDAWNNQASPIVPASKLNFTFWIGRYNKMAPCGSHEECPACCLPSSTYFQSQLDEFKSRMSGEHGFGFWYSGGAVWGDTENIASGRTRLADFSDRVAAKYGV